jgi:hypothetical protein
MKCELSVEAISSVEDFLFHLETSSWPPFPLVSKEVVGFWNGHSVSAKTVFSFRPISRGKGARTSFFLNGRRISRARVFEFLSSGGE